MIRRGAPVLVLALALASLGGCVTLFPKEAPEQLYRFGEAVQPAPATGASFTVRRANLGFDSAASGEEILTVTGDQAAYVQGGRWMSPAQTQFEAALQRGFDSPGGGARLIAPGQAGAAKYVLKLDVGRFEARYDHGAGAAPTIVVRLHAALTLAEDQSLVGERDFDAEIPASDNRVGPIADAFDQATAKVVGDLVTWVDQTGAGGA